MVMENQRMVNATANIEHRKSDVTATALHFALRGDLASCIVNVNSKYKHKKPDNKMKSSGFAGLGLFSRRVSVIVAITSCIYIMTRGQHGSSHTHISHSHFTFHVHRAWNFLPLKFIEHWTVRRVSL
jgi:hypothetical protein